MDVRRSVLSIGVVSCLAFSLAHGAANSCTEFTNDECSGEWQCAYGCQEHRTRLLEVRGHNLDCRNPDTKFAAAINRRLSSKCTDPGLNVVFSNNDRCLPISTVEFLPCEINSPHTSQSVIIQTVSGIISAFANVWAIHSVNHRHQA